MKPRYLSLRKHILNDIKPNVYGYAFSMAVLTLSVLLAGMSLLMFRATQQTIPTLPKQSGAVVTVQPGSSASELEGLADELRKWPQVADVVVIPKKESPTAIESCLLYLRRLFTGNPENPASPALVLVFKDMEGEEAALAESMDRLKQFRQVDQIRPGMPWQGKTEFLAAVTGGITVFCALVVFLVISGWIQVTLAARSDELEIRSLLGAEPFFTGLPYCAEGAFLGVTCVVAAAILFVPLTAFVKGTLAPQFSAAISVTTREVFGCAAGAAGLGLLLGFSAGWVAFKRFFRRFAG